MSDPISSSAPEDEVEYNNEDTTSSSILTRQLAAQYPEYENYPSQPQYPSGNDVIDRSSQHDTEKVVEVSPNGRYARLNTVLGKGAYKIVYKAIDRDEGYEIAWNVLQISRQEFKDLGHEIDILKSVRHPNIITFHDAWHNDSEFIFITELMTSGTLREYIRKLSLPNIKIIKRWSRQILKGLAYLHSHEPPIIHRDLKCDNIFINGAHGEVKIGDLGTAQRTSPLMSTAKRYTVIGTPEFMAPEMYEERGYNDKVDIYAFGMCLLEMATGEYPYAECKNAAQVFKKVTQNIKPESLSKVQNPEVLALINSCLASEHERMSAQEILEHSFLAVEPEVVLLATDATKKQLTLQVVFKGMDRLSVKFEFNSDTDTAEEVVNEMIEEQVLPDRYQQLITNEINRILRDMNKEPGDENKEEDRMVWRRENDIRSELERARQELVMATDRAHEAEKLCMTFEQRVQLAEERYIDFMEKREAEHETLAPPVESSSSSTHMDDDRIWESSGRTSHSALMAHVLSGNWLVINHNETTCLTEYDDDTSIEKFVNDTAIATNRERKTVEWAAKLRAQDIMTVGDLRDLHDEDWSGIGLTVFALRALKNMLRHSKKRPDDHNTL
ncbi:hypothetical protein K450DRAFT_177613 [Umbelopsis ramanniana AG]|uniref:Protein kinase domain-containing protein n=1 Tax=Umbelopsis ramanniana AG TaxID=1314678 RepID=A0AAD5HB25_UMBRA|nr:uncharacterized protein K450DRAFT_177613 [Umbelopsis ramanniana AG]KAI8577547.1 hypothetical protein K450DRAFT_177613 [Umbelopsis ramanniana AG]